MSNARSYVSPNTMGKLKHVVLLQNDCELVDFIYENIFDDL